MSILASQVLEFLLGIKTIKIGWKEYFEMDCTCKMHKECNFVKVSKFFSNVDCQLKFFQKKRVTNFKTHQLK